MPFHNYHFPSPCFFYQSLPSFFPHKIPLSTMHFGSRTYVCCCIENKLQQITVHLGTEGFTVTLQRKQRNPTLRNAVDTPQSFQRFSTWWTESNQLPSDWDQAEFRARCSTSCLPRNNWNTQEARVHPHLLGPRGSTRHSWACLLGLHSLSLCDTLLSRFPFTAVSFCTTVSLRVCFPGLRLPGEFTYPPGFSYHLGTSKALSRGQSSLLNFRLMCLLSDSLVGPCRHLKSTLFP